MCVKEFLGYMCGHCSMPYLRLCPVTASNPTFPVCKFPAERPIFTKENCHSCNRVLWNMEVLRKEEEHRQLHKQGECHCEVIFDTEERERRLRPRGGKGKGKAKEVARIDYASRAGGEEGADKGRAIEDTAGTRQDVVEARPSCPRRDWAPEAQKAAYQYVGYHISGGYGPMNLAQQEQGGGIPVGPGNTPTDSVPFAGGVGRMDLDQVAAGHGFPVGGFIQREYLWEGQMEIGQPGAGMKWYPQQHEANMPTLLNLYPPASTRVFDKMPREWQRAKSEPPEKTSYTASPIATFKEPATIIEPPQPAIVSSDMAL
jgi:hypothetical protein